MTDSLLQARQLMAEALNDDVANIGQDTAIAGLEGWDSLAFMRFIVALEEYLGREIDPEELIAIDTIAAVAALIDRYQQEIPLKSVSRPDSYSIENLVAAYRSEMIVLPDKRVRRLCEKHIGQNLDAIYRDLTALRQKTDDYFYDIKDRVEKGDFKVTEGERSKLAQYPVKCCLEISRHILHLLSKEPVPDDFVGVRALREYCREGGSLIRVWGALRGVYFQNAIQAGSFYIDVANDTVDVTKDKVEILPLRESGFRNIETYQEFTDVAEDYWHCKIVPNRFFPNLAPFVPMIAFADNGEVHISSQNAFMFPMNLDKNFELARDFIFESGHRAEEIETYRAVLENMMADRNGANESDLLYFNAESNDKELEGSFASTRAAGSEELSEIVYNILTMELNLGKSD